MLYILILILFKNNKLFSYIFRIDFSEYILKADDEGKNEEKSEEKNAENSEEQEDGKEKKVNKNFSTEYSEVENSKNERPLRRKRKQLEQKKKITSVKELEGDADSAAKQVYFFF
jgi:hypothetical protein